MRKIVFVGTLLIVSVLLNGCIVVSSNKTQAPPPKPADKKTCAESPQVRATLAEINAAAKLTSQSARANIYSAIAGRPGLSPEERIHLANAITTTLTSQSDREDVLMILVNNHPPTSKRTPRPKPTPEPSTACTEKSQKDSTSKVPATEK